MPTELKMFSRIVLGLLLITLTCWLPVLSAENGTNGVIAENLTSGPSINPSVYIINIDPIGIRSKEEIIIVNGSTNLPISKKITIEIIDYQWFFSKKTKASPEHPSSESYQSIPNIPIIPTTKSPIETNQWAIRNRWSVNITNNVHGLKNADYLIKVYSSVDLPCNTTGCAIPQAVAIQVFSLGTRKIPSETGLTQIDNQNFPQITNKITRSPTTPAASLNPFLFIFLLGIIVITKFISRKRG